MIDISLVMGMCMILHILVYIIGNIYFKLIEYCNVLKRGPVMCCFVIFQFCT